MSVFAKRIETLMKENGLNIKEMSEKTGISTSSFGDWIRNDHFPNGFNLIKLSQAFDVSTDWLLEISNFRKVKR